MEEESFELGDAQARIDRAGVRVRVGRQWRARSFCVVGLLTVGYFALMGSVHDASSGFPGAVLTVLPAVAVISVVEVLNRRLAPGGRRAVRREQWLAAAYALLACLAGVLAVLLPHPLPAAMAGVLPAVPCALGAWWAGRR